MNNNIFSRISFNIKMRRIKSLLQMGDYRFFFTELTMLKPSDTLDSKVIDQIIRKMKSDSAFLDYLTWYSFAFPAVLSNNYAFMRELILLNSDMMQYCTITNPKLYEELLDLAIQGDFNIKDLWYSYYNNDIIQTSYDIMKVLITKDPTSIMHCTITDPKQYGELLDFAIQNGLDIDSFYPNSIVYSSFELMKMLVARKPNLIQNAIVSEPSQLEELIDIAVDNGFKIHSFLFFSDEIATSLELMKVWVARSPNLIYRCRIKDQQQYEELILFAIDKGFELSEIMMNYDLSVMILSSYNLLRKVIPKKPDWIRKCAITNLDQYKELFDLAVKNGFDITTNGYNSSFSSELASSYEIMKFLIPQNPKLINKCKVSDLKQYEELIDLAIDSGFDIYDLHISEDMRTSYEMLKMLITKDCRLIRAARITDPKQYVDLLVLAIKNGWEAHPMDIASWDSIRSSYELMKKLIQANPIMIGICTIENLEEYEELLDLALSLSLNKEITIQDIPDKAASSYRIMMKLVQIDYNSMKLCTITNPDQYKELLNLAINKGFDISALYWFLPPKIQSSYEIMELLVLKDCNFISKCSTADPDSFVKLLNSAVKNGFNIEELLVSKPSNILSSYEIMKYLVTKMPNIMESCKVTNYEQYIDLLLSAIDNGLNGRSRLITPNIVCPSYDLLMKAIPKAPWLINICAVNNVAQYEELFNLALKSGLKTHMMENLPNEVVSSYELMKIVLSKVPMLITECKVTNVEQYKDLIRIITNGNLDFKLVHTLPIEILSSYELLREIIPKAPWLILKSEVFDPDQYKDLFYLAVNNGYKFDINDYESADYMFREEAIKYAIEHNIHEICFCYMGGDDNTINAIIKNFLGDSYNESQKEVYLSYWKALSRPQERKNCCIAFKSSSLDLLRRLKINDELFITFTINNPLFSEYAKLVEKNPDKIEEFVHFYTSVKDNYFSRSDKAFGIDIFLKLVRFYNIYPGLSLKIVDTAEHLSDSEFAVFMRLLNGETKAPEYINVSSLGDINLIDAKVIDNALKSETISTVQLKNVILGLLVNIDFVQCKLIFEKYMSVETAEKITKKAIRKHNQELFAEAAQITVLLKIIEDTIFAVDDIASLKRLLVSLRDNPQYVDKIRRSYYDLIEKIRNIYELDAKASLIDLDDENLKRRKSAIGDYEIIELSGEDYGFYAHTMEVKDIEVALFGKRTGKNVTICVSPVSSCGQVLYFGRDSSRITIGFTKINRGSFVGSSNANMGSDRFVIPNNYLPRDERAYYQLLFEESSQGLDNINPETLLYRNGLQPSCIIIANDEPTAVEIQAKQIIEARLGHPIPFVHTDKRMIKDEFKADEKVDDAKGEEIANQEIDALRSIKKIVDALQLSFKDIYKIEQLHIGNSHDMFKCRVRGKDGSYIIKPGYSKDGTIQPYRSYIIKAVYDIQKIVNPDSAVWTEVKEIELPATQTSTSKTIVCSIAKFIPNTRQYSFETFAHISESEISSLIRESLVDYLTFNYDTKVENFIRGNGKTYGIDKEQALRFAVKNGLQSICDFNEHLSYNPNNVSLVYPFFFSAIQDGTVELTVKNIQDISDAISNVEILSDEEYIKIFAEYLNSRLEYGSINEEQKRQMIDAIISRKTELRKSFGAYFCTVLDEYGQVKGVDVSEWKKIILSSVKEKSLKS